MTRDPAGKAARRGGAQGKSMRLSIRPEGSQALARLGLAALVLVGMLLIGFVVTVPLDVTRQLLSTFVSHGMVKLLYPETPYDPITDFAPVVQLVDTETALVVRADSPYATFAQLVEGVKKRGRPLEIGNFGNGSSFHFYSLILGQGAGIDVLPVPYKGEALSLTDMMGGHVEASFNSVGTALPHIRDGRVRALAVLAPKRSRVLPDVPTFIELGFPRLRAGGWFGVLAPAGTPKPVIDKIRTDVQAVLREPDVTKWLRDQGLEPTFESSDAFGQSMKREAVEWEKLIKEFNVSVN